LSDELLGEAMLDKSSCTKELMPGYPD